MEINLGKGWYKIYQDGTVIIYEQRVGSNVTTWWVGSESIVRLTKATVGNATMYKGTKLYNDQLAILNALGK